MASSNVKPNRMTRLESKKSHSWWWDSHISPINSKWLQENLEEMDQRVKQMLKLIEEDGDSFAKKAEMYYQKRPELIRLVEDFYRRYRSLAERYDNVTGELRKTIPSDLQSQGSGMSDLGWEPPSTMPSPDLRPSRRKSGHRAPVFDYFLGGDSSDVYNKEGDESSAFDSGSESDEYFNKSEEHGLRRKVIELEVELREVKEKLLMRDEESFKSYSEDGPGKMGRYEEEIKSLKMELQKYKSLGDTDDVLPGGVVNPDDPVVLDSEGDVLDSMHKIQRLEEELRITRDKLRETEEEVASLREELTRKGSSMRHLQEELFNWKIKLEKEQGEVSKLQAGDEDQEIRACSNKILSEGNEQLQGEMTRLSKQRACLENSLKELDVRCHGVEEELRRVKDEKAETEAMLGSQIKQLKAELAYTNECMEELKKNLDALQVRYDEVVVERDELNENISELALDASFKDDQIDQMSNHLHQLHTEHVDMIAGVEGAHRLAEELRSRIKELEREVEKKQEIIVQGAEEKREAIRQLCFSLEHYRNGYHKLREVVNGQKSVEAT